MPDGPYPTPDEIHLIHMLNEAGSPEGAGTLLVRRLEALEAATAALEARVQAEAQASEVGEAGPEEA